MAAYGRLPSEFDETTAMGLALNIPMIEARVALSLMQGISAAFGDEKTLEHVLHIATGDASLAFAARIRAQHARAASQ